MHDLHEADKIFKLILEKAKENKLSNIKKVVINLGNIVEHGQSITPENIKFNIELLAQNTIAEGVKITINKTDEAYWELVEISGE